MKLQDLIILVVIFFLLMLMLAWFVTTYNAETKSSKKCKKHHHHEQYKQVPKTINKLKMNTVHKPVPEPYAKSVVKSSLKEDYVYEMKNKNKVCSTTGPKLGQCVQCNENVDCTSNKPKCNDGICIRDTSATESDVCGSYVATDTNEARTVLETDTASPQAGACVECTSTNVINCNKGSPGQTPTCVENTCTYNATACDADTPCPSGSYCEGTTCIAPNCGSGEGQVQCSNYTWSDQT